MTNKKNITNSEQLASFEFYKTSERGFAKCHVEVYGNL